jgi:hypothetical protein
MLRASSSVIAFSGFEVGVLDSITAPISVTASPPSLHIAGEQFTLGKEGDPFTFEVALERRWRDFLDPEFHPPRYDHPKPPRNYRSLGYDSFEGWILVPLLEHLEPQRHAPWWSLLLTNNL